MDLARVRPTQVEVDLSAIAHNIKALHQLAPQTGLMAVVKADGYGHGVVPIAQTAVRAGAAWLGVATVEEAVELAETGLSAPILVLGYVPPNMADLLVRYSIRTALYDLALTAALAEAARAAGGRVLVHMKVDSGMGRLGVRPSEALSFARAVQAMPELELEGVFTHFATADEPENDFADRQLAVFDSVLAELKAHGIKPKIRHASNSAGIMLLPQGRFDLVRAGIAMYGLEPDPSVNWPVDLRPALTWRTKISMVKEVPPDTPLSYGCTYRTTRTERVATLPVGYADGFSRLLSNRGQVLIGGRRCPIVGRVCMDQCIVRLPDDLDARVGDEAVLIGRQGEERITAADIARIIGTINYEVVCGISKRVPRLYLSDGAPTN